MGRRTFDPRDVVAGLIAAELEERSATSPGVPALIAVNADGHEEVCTWHELQQAVRAQAEILSGIRLQGRRPVVYVNAGADFASAITILACLIAKVPVLALTTKHVPGFQQDMLRLLREQYGEPISASAVASGDRNVISRAFAGDVEEPPALPGTMPPMYLLASSGSTGVPKIIPHWSLLGNRGSRFPNLLFARSGWRRGQRQLIIASLYHIVSFTTFVEGVASGGLVVLQETFLPSQVLSLVHEHGIEWFMTTPMHMREMLDVGARLDHALRTVRAILHGAGPCPLYVKKEWLDVLGPGRVYETYGATEGIGSTLVNGREWLKYPGTVGRGFFTRVLVCDRDGSSLEPGEVGRVYMCAAGIEGHGNPRRPWLKQIPGDLQSLGDLGWLNRDGYLFLAGREQDQIVVDGVEVTPAKVDALLYKHPDIKDVITFIVEQEDAAHVLRTVVVPWRDRALDEQGLMRLFSAELSAAETPLSVAITEYLPRTEIGKIRRRISNDDFNHLIRPSA